VLRALSEQSERARNQSIMSLAKPQRSPRTATSIRNRWLTQMNAD